MNPVGEFLGFLLNTPTLHIYVEVSDGIPPGGRLLQPESRDTIAPLRSITDTHGIIIMPIPPSSLVLTSGVTGNFTKSQ